MISCIICSRQPDISGELKENIASTIGCEYELVVIDNSKNEYSIFSAYNEGIRLAKGDILCFMHEDILFRSDDWGTTLKTTLQDSSIGIVGVIGSQFLPNKMASWWLCENTKGTVLQGERTSNGKYISSLDGVEVSDVTDVVVVDGLWFAMKRELTNHVQFDDKTYNSFHCYDVDICMQAISNDRRVVVIPNVLIEHTSMGNVLTTYYQQLQCFYDKWQSMLPIWRGIELDANAALHMSNILEKYQKVVCRNVVLVNSKSYRLGKSLLTPLKKIFK